MNKLKLLFVLLLLTGSHVAQADVTYDFVRIACVPENGLLDVEYRGLHDAVSGDLSSKSSGAETALSRNGFHQPRGLRFQCDLGDAKYLITAQQDETSDRMCGGSPAVYLTVSRNGSVMLKNVVFGDSCHENPSIQRFTFGDGPNVRRGREANICYATGRDTDPQRCEWTFGNTGFAKRFPIDQAAIGRVVGKMKR